MVALAVVRWWLEAGGHKAEVREAASHHIRRPEAPLPPAGDFLSLVVAVAVAVAEAHGVKEIQKWADKTERREKEKTWRSLFFFSFSFSFGIGFCLFEIGDALNSTLDLYATPPKKKKKKGIFEKGIYY